MKRPHFLAECKTGSGSFSIRRDTALNGEYEIDEQTWRSLDLTEQTWVLYRTFNRQRDICEKRMCGIEHEHTEICKLFDRRKKVDSTFAGVMGFVGGLIGFLASKLFKG